MQVRSRPTVMVSYLSWLKGSYWSTASLFGSFRAWRRHSLPPFPHAQTKGHRIQGKTRGVGGRQPLGWSLVPQVTRLESGSPRLETAGLSAQALMLRHLPPSPETGTLGSLSCSPAPSTVSLALGAWHSERAGGKDERKDWGWVGTGQMGGWHRVEMGVDG